MDAHPIPQLDRAGLRRFGLSTGALLALIFGLFLPWILSLRFPLWPWIAGGALSLWALLAPQTLDLVYRAWMRFGLVMGAIMNRVILALVFFAVMLPLGLVLRLTGHDPLARRFDPEAKSYRVPSRVRPDSSMEKPY